MVLGHRGGDGAQPFSRDPANLEGYRLEAGNLESLAFFNNFDEGRGFREGIVRAGIKPGVSTPEGLHFELTVGEKGLIDAGNLKFASGRGLDVPGNAHHLVGIEVKAYHGIVALGILRFLLDAEAVA